MTAHIAAGNQPIKVSCKIKQSKDVKILPLKRKEIHGKNIAISVIIFIWFKLYVANLLICYLKPHPRLKIILN